MDCPFCEYSRPNMVLLKNSLTYVIPDFSPLTVGHLLILPYKHTHGIANLDSNTILDINKSISYIQDIYSDRHGIFFEHGAVLPSTAGSSISHAHLHFLPTFLDIGLLLVEHGFALNKVISISHLSELQRFSIEHQPYIYWRYFNGEGFAYPVGQLKSQFLRHTIGKIINATQNYDWHSDSLSDRAKDLVSQTIVDWNIRKTKYVSG